MKILAHIATVAVILGLFAGYPLSRCDIGALAAGDMDAVSSATVIQDAPSGRYTIVINADKHPDRAKRDTWVTFFRGDPVGVIMEDISCVVLDGDAAGLDMATSLQSRLPANQMTLRREAAALALSKAEAGRFDVLVMSDEAALSWGSDTLDSMPNTVVVHR